VNSRSGWRSQILCVTSHSRSASHEFVTDMRTAAVTDAATINSLPFPFDNSMSTTSWFVDEILSAWLLQ